MSDNSGGDANTNMLLRKLQSLETICQNLNCEISALKAENRQLKMGISNPESSLNENQKVDVHYITDEDDLATETEWIIKKRPSKKRKAETSPEIQNTCKNDEGKSKNEVNTNEKQIPKKLPTSKPPPIMVSSVSDYQEFYKLVQNKAKSEFTIKLLNNGVYKVNVLNSDDYRSLTKSLNTAEIAWYSYENAQERPIKVVIKNLHHSWDPAEIIADLKRQNLKAVSATNKMQYKTKKPLDMFLVSFEACEEIKKVHEIRSILNRIVKIEPTKRSKLIPQCKVCQSFGHTQNYCGKPARCVKCAGKHKTIECLKTETEQPKCVNCGEAHPANYIYI